jgi:hypothetical protein
MIYRMNLPGCFKILTILLILSHLRWENIELPR